jgi:hypothetical protein
VTSRPPNSGSAPADLVCSLVINSPRHLPSIGGVGARVIEIGIAAGDLAVEQHDHAVARPCPPSVISIWMV